jgi:hypothetical protein
VLALPPVVLALPPVVLALPPVVLALPPVPPLPGLSSSDEQAGDSSVSSTRQQSGPPTLVPDQFMVGNSNTRERCSKRRNSLSARAHPPTAPHFRC